ncbi:Calx-beta domain-containing protein [Geminocystis sp. NIES-3709]|uniref:Calx-beta domain-containing protein n=1 Tax=Geminocystis sp. NIES-3709 TaxID=1617448 RepID=UPI0005FC8E51|nr:Calx-beta domain-containing protein [Geminocystis sp. NIES-3709]BAQ63741.1 alkaline phosphatase [Geminocystis sp. NIES-3709]
MVTQLISKNASNQPANNSIVFPIGGGNIDTASNLIVFSTTAFNFIPDTNGVEDIYLYNKTTKTFINLTALKANGTPTTLGSSNPSISGSGNKIVFESLEPNLASIPALPGSDIFLVEDFSSTPPKFTLLTAGYNNVSFNPFISQNGNWVVFETLATTQGGGAALTNVPDGGDGDRDIILLNLITNQTTWVSQVTNGGGNGVGDSTNSSVSDDGRYVVFQSNVNNLIPTVTDTNGTTDIFLFDKNNNSLTLISKKINAVAPVTTANASSINPIISDNGRYIAYESVASDLVSVDSNGVRDIFVYDIQLGTNKLISLRPNGVQTTADSRNATISDNGEFIAFESNDASLVSSDNNNLTDIFIWNNDTISLFSSDSAGNEGNKASTNASISSDGQEVIFISNATNLDTSVPGQNGVTQELFVASATPPPNISIGNVTVSENAGTATLTVSLSTAGTSPITVDYKTTNGTATSGTDYQAIPTTTLTFNPGELQKQVVVNILDDTVIEQQEIFTVDLSNAIGATILTNGDKGTVTINDNDTPPEPLLNTPFTRFQNKNRSGTYLFTGPQESQSVRQNFPNFVEEGTAFKVAVQPNDDLIRINRFQNEDVPGTYLFAGEVESQSIRQNFPNFIEEGIAFYVYDKNASQGVDFYRFQNTQQPGTYLFVGQEERDSILANFPQFKLEGVAFEVVV